VAYWLTCCGAADGIVASDGSLDFIGFFLGLKKKKKSFSLALFFSPIVFVLLFVTLYYRFPDETSFCFQVLEDCVLGECVAYLVDQ